MLTLPPDGARSGACILRFVSIKKKLSGDGRQLNCVVRLVEATLSNRSSNRVPDPDNGVKSFEYAEIRSVLIGPGPAKIFPATFQLPFVIPAF